MRRVKEEKCCRFEANARERSRVQHLGVQFERLRDCLPIEDQRLSKLTILRYGCLLCYMSFTDMPCAQGSLIHERQESDLCRVAKEYIAYLALLLSSESDSEMETASTRLRQFMFVEMQPRR